MYKKDDEKWDEWRKWSFHRFLYELMTEDHHHGCRSSIKDKRVIIPFPLRIRGCHFEWRNRAVKQLSLIMKTHWLSVYFSIHHHPHDFSVYHFYRHAVVVPQFVFICARIKTFSFCLFVHVIFWVYYFRLTKKLTFEWQLDPQSHCYEWHNKCQIEIFQNGRIY